MSTVVMSNRMWVIAGLLAGVVTVIVCVVPTTVHARGAEMISDMSFLRDVGFWLSVGVMMTGSVRSRRAPLVLSVVATVLAAVRAMEGFVAGAGMTVELGAEGVLGIYCLCGASLGGHLLLAGLAKVKRRQRVEGLCVLLLVQATVVPWALFAGFHFRWETGLGWLLVLFSIAVVWGATCWIMDSIWDWPDD